MQIIGQLRSRIRYKIIGPFLILAAATAVVGSAIAYLLIASSWQERFVNQLAAITRIANDTLVEQETTNLMFLRQIAFASSNVETGAPAISAALAEDDRDGLLLALDPFMRVGIASTNTQLDRLIVFDESGQSVADLERASDAEAGYVIHSPRDFSQTWFVPKVLAGVTEDGDDKFAGLVELPDSEGNPVTHLCTIVPIREDDESPIVGGAILAVRLESLLSVLHQRSQAAIVTLYDVHGEALATTIPGEDLQSLRIEKEHLTRLQETASVNDLDDNPVVNTLLANEREYEVFYTYLVLHNSRVGILSTGMPSDYVAQWQRQTRPMILGLTILVMLAIIIIGVIVTRQVTTPLEQLVTTASTFVAGGLKQDGSSNDMVPVTYHGVHDEVGVLSSSFRRMTEDQRRLIRRVMSEASHRAAIFESIPDGMVVSDSTGRVHSINPTMRQWLGMEPHDDLPPSFQDLPLEHISEPIFGAQMKDLYTLPEDRIVRVSKSPILVNNNTYIGDVYVLQDMTAEVNVDRARTNFTATISHEMRTPLTVIHGNTQLLQQGLAGTLSDLQQQLVTTIYQHSGAMSRSLANIILVAEMDSGSLSCKPKPLDLHEALPFAVQPLQHALQQAELTLTLDIPDDLPTIVADEFLFSQIIQHLVQNAHTYTPPQGSITIQAQSNGYEVRLDVTDTGCGIAPTLLERVFERFVRGEDDESNNRPDRGIGLGLSIVKHLVELQGGRVWISSELQHGTTVSLTLPHSTTTMPSIAANGDAAAALPTAEHQHQHGAHPHDTPTNGTAPAPAGTMAMVPVGEAAHHVTYGIWQTRPDMLTLPTLMTFVMDMAGYNPTSLTPIKEVLQAQGFFPTSAPHEPSAAARVHHLDTLPSTLFQRLLLDTLPMLHQRWHMRQRPLLPLHEWARQHFTAVLSADVAMLTALSREAGAFQSSSMAKPLAFTYEHIAALLDINSQLPRALWYDEEHRTRSEHHLWERLKAILQPDMLLIGQVDDQVYATLDYLTDLGVSLILTTQQPPEHSLVETLEKTTQVHDRVIQLQGDRQKGVRHPMRLIERRHREARHCYLSNTLDPSRLTSEQIFALSEHHGSVEHIFAAVHQLFLRDAAIAHHELWRGSRNGVQVQLWTTWVIHSILLDLADSVAEHLQQPAGTVALPGIYHGIRNFYRAYQHGEAENLMHYLAAHAHDLGIIKSKGLSYHHTIASQHKASEYDMPMT